MKKLFMIGSMLLSSIILYGQSNEKSPLEGESAKSQPPAKHLGWYISLCASETQLRSVTVDMPGMSLAVIIDQKLALGLKVNVMDNFKKIGGIYPDRDTYLRCGYGGAFIQPIIRPEKRFHFTFPVCIGLGVAGYFEKPGDAENNAYVSGNVRLKDQDVFLVLEPGVECEVNALKWMKFSAGISYRFAGGLNIHNTGEHDFDGLIGSARIKLGCF